MTFDDGAVHEVLAAYVALAPAGLSPEERRAAHSRGRALRRRRQWASFGLVALLAGGAVVVVAEPFGSGGASVLVPAQTPEPTPGPPSPSLTAEDAAALAVCRQHFSGVVTAQASVVAAARSHGGPMPFPSPPSGGPQEFPGLAEDSPIAICLVRTAGERNDTVYGVAQESGEELVLHQQSGSDQILLVV